VAPSQEATSRLAAEHANDGGPYGEEPSFVSTDRPLTPRQARVPGDPDVTTALLLEGDLVVFDSGALHFASNRADGLAGALYDGLMTSVAVPRLRPAAAKQGGSHPGSDDAYQDHLYAADLLRLVERRGLELRTAPLGVLRRGLHRLPTLRNQRTRG
jgi:hypothetical protein